VLSEGPPPSFGVAPPVQAPPPTADLPSPEWTTEPTLEPTVEPTWEPTTEPTIQVTVEPTAQPSPEPTTQVREGPDYAFAQALLQLTNETRIANGLAPLNEDPALVAASQKYAEVHVRLSPLQLSHGVDGSTLKDRIEREGYTGWACLGENLHLNPLDVTRTVEQTFQNWMTGAHRDNILDPNFEDIGIGCYAGMAEPYPVQICVQNFGARS
jgi:uncharacterized protein YkwD